MNKGQIINDAIAQNQFENSFSRGGAGNNNKWTLGQKVFALFPSVLLVFLYFYTINFLRPGVDRGTCLGDGCIQLIFIILFVLSVIDAILFLLLIRKQRTFSLVGILLAILLPVLFILML